MLLYFAAPLFSQAELAFNQVLTDKIEGLGFDVFLPQRDGDTNTDGFRAMTSDERARAIFHMDLKRIEATDIFLYVLDGRIPDEGAAVALGLAYSHKKYVNKNQRLIGLHTDKRAAFIDEKLNPMIFSSLDYIATSEEALLSYLSKI